ncbi:hypothetical protein FB480_11431 [Agrobacterium vitis]|nr:hypothetical protein FB480_11431 [Agrobacterium vitis]
MRNGPAECVSGNGFTRRYSASHQIWRTELYVSEIRGSLLKTSGSAYPISPLVGEMAGKPEGGKRHIKAFASCTVVQFVLSNDFWCEIRFWLRCW